MQKAFLYFIVSFAILLSFFYFYPAPIFPAEISNDIISLKADVSLKTFIHQNNLPEGIIQDEFTKINLTFQGYFLLFVCLIGLPLMIALRFGGKLKKTAQENSEHK